MVKPMFKAKLIDVGHSRYNGEIIFGSLRTLKSEIQKHMASKRWALSFGDGDTTAGVYVGGVRRVGTVELIAAKFKVITSDTADVIPIEPVPGAP